MVNCYRNHYIMNAAFDLPAGKMPMPVDLH
jgi:hypothetical protein